MSNQSEIALTMRDQIIEALKTIEDPEIFLDIWFLGLIYRVEPKEDGLVEIDLTFTTPLCPAGPQIIGEIQEKVGKIAGVTSVQIKVVFDPPWQPSDEVKGMLGMM